MAELGGCALILIVAILVIFLVACFPLWLMTPGKAVWTVGFILAKKCKWIKISWWWILLGLLIPF